MNDFKLVLDTEEPIYWPCWPFRLSQRSFYLKGGFKLRVFQREGRLFTKDAVALEGYVSRDRGEVTTTVDFNQGTRLKRKTPGGVA
jgi:hypothetical protein